MATISHRLADALQAIEYNDIPTEVIAKARLLVLDTVGVCHGSTRLGFGQDILALAESQQTDDGTTVIGAPFRTAPHYAAFVNGVLGHGQDYDDTHTESVVHPSGALVPVMFACGERDGITGAQALRALVLGTECAIRLALPARNAFHLGGFHTTSVAGTFGAALLSTISSGASRAVTVDALGICGSFASGLLQCVPASSSAKKLHAGWAGLCGIMAADLARAGFDGPSSVIEGKLGLYNSMLPDHAFDLEEIFADLGDRWHLLDTRPKIYPCCHYLQAFIDCAAVLRAAEGFDTDAITGIHCEVAQGSVNMICDPWEAKQAPVTGYDARFSLPYAVSVMLEKGRAGLVEFDDESVGDPAVARLMPKVTYEVNPAFSVMDMPGRVTITFVDGSERTHLVPKVRGDSEAPFSEAEILDKFRICTAHLGNDRSVNLAEAILDLDRRPTLAGILG